MENIAELRKICQTTAKKDRSNVYMRYVSRFFSIYLTRFLLPTQTTANQVSFAMIVAGIVASLFLLSPLRWLFLIGGLLLQFWYILDCMDGEVARYRHFQKTRSVVIDKSESSLTGMYYDIINHYIVNLLVPAMLGLGLFYATGSSFFVFMGILGGLAQVLMLAMHDGKYRPILNHLKKYKHIEVIKAKESAENDASKKRSVAHVAFMVLHYTMTYPTVMNLVLCAGILEFFCPSVLWREILIVYLTLGTLVVTVTIIGRTIKEQLPDQELRTQFQSSD